MFLQLERLEISSRQGGDPPQKTATKELGKPSSTTFEPPKFLSYLAHLHDLGYASRTVSLHRSIISVTIPFINGVAAGSHPLVTRMCKGSFEKRPPRKIPKVWDPDPVLQIFMHWNLPLSCARIVRKCAFIVALLSGRRLSELFDLKCDSNHLQLTNTFVQLIPALLSKSNRAGRIGPSLRSYSEDASLCPVAIICALLVKRDALDIRHDHLFFNPRRQDSLVTLATFKGFIEEASATLASTPPQDPNAPWQRLPPWEEEYLSVTFSTWGTGPTVPPS
jgi:hypothetical protein